MCVCVCVCLFAIAPCFFRSLLIVQNSVKATRLVNGKSRYLGPQRSKTPKPINIKLDRDDYVGDRIPHANFGISTLKRGWFCTCVKLSSSVSISILPR